MKRLRWPTLPRLKWPVINPELAAFAAGLVLFGVGLGLWYLPAGLAGPGAVLMLVALFGDKRA